ncbi:MAG: cysteine dioxygenase family protein [Paracoccaceae bacterium]|nr:cysteine dioxygenase family protein [Paracoccaceae bacterium]
MTDIAEQRTREVSALIADTRAIMDGGAFDRAALGQVRERMLGIAARRDFWSEAEYPSPPEGEDQNRYLVGQEGPADGPGGIALYLNIMKVGKKIPPHNHTTWACIAGIEGVEHNTLYDRLDDGSEPGKAQIKPRETIAVEPGSALAMMGDDIHSVEIKGDQVIRHLHFYGRPLETLDKRLTFDIEAGTCKVMTMPVKTKIKTKS